MNYPLVEVDGSLFELLGVIEIIGVLAQLDGPLKSQLNYIEEALHIGLAVLAGTGN